MEKENYNKNFLSEETNLLCNTLTKVAEKIYDRMKEEKRSFLCTDRNNSLFDKKKKDYLYDSLYGYIYDESALDVLERQVKGFAVINNALLICMDLNSVYYSEDVLKETFDSDYDDCWYCLYTKDDNKLHFSDDMNTLLTVLSIAECLYQYFD